MSTTTDLAQIIEQSPELGWLERAACASLDIADVDMFFVGAGKSLSAEAKAMCRGCEVRTECLTHAYDREIAGGYFGGVSPIKRRKLSLDDALALIESEK